MSENGSDGITRIAPGETSESVTRLRFRRSARDCPSPAVLDRQGRIAILAFGAFANRDEARAFLNEDNQTLGGRPIDIAGETDEGFESIAAALRARSKSA